MYLKLCKIYGTINYYFSCSDTAPEDGELYANMYTYQCDVDKPEDNLPRLFDTSTNTFIKTEKIEPESKAAEAIKTFFSKMDSICSRYTYDKMFNMESSKSVDDSVTQYESELKERVMKLMEEHE